MWSRSAGPKIFTKVVAPVYESLYESSLGLSPTLGMCVSYKV